MSLWCNCSLGLPRRLSDLLGRIGGLIREIMVAGGGGNQSKYLIPGPPDSCQSALLLMCLDEMQGIFPKEAQGNGPWTSMQSREGARAREK